MIPREMERQNRLEWRSETEEATKIKKQIRGDMETTRSPDTVRNRRWIKRIREKSQEK